MELGKRIAYYRKSKNITQEVLAGQLGISNQAVSKWETEQSCPDVELLPKIADVFEITLDELFEREMPKREKTGIEQEVKNPSLPWEDDETLRVVVFVGHEMKEQKTLEEALRDKLKQITFQYYGPALNVESCLSVCCQDVESSVAAGTYVECGSIGGNVAAGTYLECGDVSGSIKAGAYVECGDVAGNVTAGGYVECGDVGGNVKAGDSLYADDVECEWFDKDM